MDRKVLCACTYMYKCTLYMEMCTYTCICMHTTSIHATMYMYMFTHPTQQSQCTPDYWAHWMTVPTYQPENGDTHTQHVFMTWTSTGSYMYIVHVWVHNVHYMYRTRTGGHLILTHEVTWAFTLAMDRMSQGLHVWCMGGRCIYTHSDEVILF